MCSDNTSSDAKLIYFIDSTKQNHEKHHGGLPHGWRREASKECFSFIAFGVSNPLL